MSLNTTGGFDIASAKLIETLKTYQKFISSYGLSNECIIEKRRKIAFVMPFRDNGSNVRTSQLFWLINTYIPIFIKQKADVQFFVINQGINKSIFKDFSNIQKIRGSSRYTFQQSKTIQRRFSNCQRGRF